MAISENKRRIRAAKIKQKADKLKWTGLESKVGNYFRFYYTIIGFAMASLFWGVCFHLWGA